MTKPLAAWPNRPNRNREAVTDAWDDEHAGAVTDFGEGVTPDVARAEAGPASPTFSQPQASRGGLDRGVDRGQQRVGNR